MLCHCNNIIVIAVESLPSNVSFRASKASVGISIRLKMLLCVKGASRQQSGGASHPYARRCKTCTYML